MKKVVIGISGGVDSAVAALLLKKQGYDVIGLFMRNWDSELNDDVLGNPNATTNICPQDEDMKDAKAVCDKLDIPFHEVNFVKEYWDLVFKYFLKELKKGRTPNPDILCNKFIKFDLFKKEAERLGANLIATGHYARVENGILKRGIDENKDQTYFLSQLSKNQLENVLFPLGEIKKDEVRKLAKEYDIPVAEKKDSTGICFIGERNFKKFLKNYLPAKIGNIRHITTKKILGTHEGLMYYTIGQRRGLNISNKESLFVVGKNLNTNELLVSESKDNEYLISNKAVITNINWNHDEKLTECTAKFIYRQKDYNINLEWIKKDTAIITYDNISAVTPGQACVFYQNDICLGGGTINEVYNNNKKLVYYE